MAVPTLHAIAEELARMDRRDLEELAFEYAKAHARVCSLVGAEDDSRHVADDVLSDRVGATATAGLANMLAPAAWLAVTAHEMEAT